MLHNQIYELIASFPDVYCLPDAEQLSVLPSFYLVLAPPGIAETGASLPLLSAHSFSPSGSEMVGRLDAFAVPEDSSVVAGSLLLSQQGLHYAALSYCSGIVTPILFETIGAVSIR